MDSAALTAYLNAEWPEVIAEASIDVSRIVSIVDEVYDADSTLDDSWAQPLGDYYLLRRAVRAFSVGFDVSLSGDSYRQSQLHKMVSEHYAAAAAQVAGIVGPDDAAEPAIVTITSDYLTGGDFT